MTPPRPIYTSLTPRIAFYKLGGGGLPNPITAEGFADSPLPQKGIFFPS